MVMTVLIFVLGTGTILKFCILALLYLFLARVVWTVSSELRGAPVAAAPFPEPAPPDSLVVIDASQFPPKVKGTVEGLEHTVQGPPQAVAVTPDGKLAVVAAPTRYDYAAKKELFDNFLQVVDIEASPHRSVTASAAP